MAIEYRIRMRQANLFACNTSKPQSLYWPYGFPSNHYYSRGRNIQKLSHFLLHTAAVASLEHAFLAQVVEHPTSDREVLSSNPNTGFVMVQKPPTVTISIVKESRKNLY